MSYPDPLPVPEETFEVLAQLRATYQQAQNQTELNTLARGEYILVDLQQPTAPGRETPFSDQ